MKSIYWRLAPIIKRWMLKILKQSSLLEKINLTLTFSFNGIPFTIPIIRGVGYQNAFMTEMWMVEVLKRLLPLKPGAFIDVGVNIGQTLLKLRAVSQSAPYLGFEPNPTCAAYVLDLILTNRFERTLMIPIGLCDSRGLMDLIFYAEDNRIDSGASLVTDPKFRPNHPVVLRQPVPVLPFSDVARYLSDSEPGLVKIDVEGGEMEVLKSMSAMIRMHQPPILLEILCMGDEMSTLAKNLLLENFFREMDYSIMRIEKVQERFGQFVLINAIGLNTDPTGWDYVAAPSRMAAGLLAVRGNQQERV